MKNIRDPKYQLRVNNPDAISGIDVLEAIQSQYAASPHMLALLVNKAALADPGKDLMLWYMSIFNPKTARGVGLDIWGRIVGASRTIEIEYRSWFGFAGTGCAPFYSDDESWEKVPWTEQGTFWRGTPAYITSDLEDEGFRELIFWKASANIASAEAPALNELLQRIFPGQTAYIVETGVMKIRVVSLFGLTDTQEALFRRYGLLAKGAGVGVSWLSMPHTVFGFAGTGFAPFNQAPFWAGQVIQYNGR